MSSGQNKNQFNL